MVGWIYALVIAQKDTSDCMTKNISDFPITLKIWFWADAGTTLFTLISYLVYYIKKYIEKK
jgi:hypothetical protein